MAGLAKRMCRLSLGIFPSSNLAADGVFTRLEFPVSDQAVVNVAGGLLLLLCPKAHSAHSMHHNHRLLH